MWCRVLRCPSDADFRQPPAEIIGIVGIVSQIDVLKARFGLDGPQLKDEET